MLGVAGTLAQAPAPAQANPSIASPTSVAAVAGKRAIVVTWAAPAATTVNHYIATANGTALSCKTSTLGCSIPGATSGTSYTATVVACTTLSDVSGCSDPSATSNAVVPGPPGVPAAPAVAYDTDPSRVIVTWPTPAAAGGGIDSYRVTPTPDAPAGSSGTCAALVPAPSQAANDPVSCGFTGLKIDQSYTFKVTANGIGTTGNSVAGPSSAAKIIGPPHQPAAPTVEWSAPDALSVTWQKPDGGPPISGYAVTNSPSDGAQTGGACGSDLVDLSCTYSGLTPTTAYTFQVTAIGVGTGSGQSLPSDPSTPMKSGTAGVPDQPEVDLGSVLGTATVSWNAPATGGDPIGYVVTSSPSGPGLPDPESPGCGDDPNVTSCDFTGLVRGHPYSFRVQTVTDVNTSDPSAASASVVSDVPGTPGTPVAVLGDGSGKVTLTWKAPADGGNVNGYTVTAIPAGGGTQGSQVAGCGFNLTVPSCSFITLDPLKSYTFTVTANGDLGSTTSLPSNAITPGAPGAPADVTVTLGTTPGSLTVNWNEPTSGGVATDYIVTATSNGGTIPSVCTFSMPHPLSCPYTGLDKDKQYAFTVTAHNTLGDTHAPVTAAIVPDKPAAPSGIRTSLVPGTAGAVTVDWDAPTTGGAVTSYTVTPTSPNGGLPLNPCTFTMPHALTCSFTELDRTKKYAFAVRATNGSGDTDAQATAEVVPDKPGVPTKVAVTLGQDPSTATVTWNDPVDGGVVTHYTVTPSPSSGSLVACDVASTVHSCLFSGLDDTTTYSFAVAAIGVVDQSTASTGPFIANKPGAPGTPTTVVTGPGVVAVTWTVPTTGGPVVDYTVTPTPNLSPVPNFFLDPITNQFILLPGDNIGSPTACQHVVADLTCSFAGLDSGTAYTFVVSANGNAGSTASAPSFPAVQPGPPSIPAVSSVANSGANAVKLTWSAVTTGGPLTDYTVVSKPSVSVPANCLRTTALTCIFDHLISGTSYEFRVQATGPGGPSRWSLPLGPITVGPPDAPGKPVVAATATSGEVRVSWGKPGIGAGISGYTVESDTTGLGCTATTETWCVVQGLGTSTAHQFRVQANGASNSGSSAFSPWSDPVVAGDGSRPGRPTAPAATVTGVGQVVVKWSAPVGGGPITNYTVVPFPSIPDAAIGCADSVAVVPCVFMGLDPLEKYSFTVVANGPAGAGNTSSEPSNPVIPGAPAMPGNPVAQSSAPNTVLVTWTPPLGEGGGPITSYSVTANPYVRPPAGCTRTAWTATSCSFTGLDAATAYTFAVTANGPAGSTRSAVRSSAVTPVGPTAPSAPTNVSATAGNQEITVSWTASTTGSVSSYRATAAPGGQSCVSTAISTACTIPDLTNGTSYAVTVVAIGSNTSGTSAPSSPAVSARPTAGAPGAPTGVTAVAGDGSAVISWLPPAAIGDGILQYVASTTSGGVPCTVSGLTCAVTGLTNGTTYQVRVVAVGVGESGTSPSSTLVPVVPVASASPVTSVTVTPGALSLAVQFVAGPNVSNVVSYTATAATEGPSQSCTTANASTTACVITGLTAGTGYSVTVVANLVGGGRSAASAAVSATVVSATAPALPTVLPTGTMVFGTLTSSASGSVPLRSTITVSGTGYAAYTGITVGVYPGNGSAPVKLATVVTDSGGSFSAQVPITGITAGSYTLVAAGTRTTAVRFRTLPLTVTSTGT